MQAYETKVLGPILGLMSQYQDVIYGFDLIDEIEAAINAGYFSNSWIGARTWIQNMTAFVKSYPCPAVQAALHDSPVVAGDVKRRLGLRCPGSHPGTLFGARPQFLRCPYLLGQRVSIRAHIPRAMLQNEDPISFRSFWANMARNHRAVQTTCDSLQTTATTNFLNGAKSSCFSSALAWKYEALNTSAPWLSYLYITGSGNSSSLLNTCTSPPPLPGPYPPSTYTCARPAYYTIQSFNP